MATLRAGSARGTSPAQQTTAPSPASARSKGQMTPREALEATQEKDMSKGAPLRAIMRSRVARLVLADPHLLPLKTALCSHRALQSDRERTHHEAELLQDHGEQSVPNRHGVPPQGTRLESERPPREFTSVGGAASSRSRLTAAHANHSSSTSTRRSHQLWTTRSQIYSR